MVFMKSALLIEASDVKGQVRIPGAGRDVENWAMYLSSDIGGAWTSIDTRSKPSKKEVRAKLDELSFFHRYVFVAFSGHGCHDAKTNRTIVLLNDTEEVDVSELLPAASCTLVVDACRGVERAQILTNSLTDAIALSESTRGMLWKTGAARGPVSEYQSLFDAHVQKYKGKATMYSCSVGEGAGEDPDNGGVYTHALLESCQTWHDGNQPTPRVLTTYAAHVFAKARLERLKSGQTPEFNSSETALLFPIAVRP